MINKKIDDIVNINDKRKQELLRILDNTVRNDTKDIVSGLENFFRAELWKNNDELVFMAYMFGSCVGSQMAVKTLSFLMNGKFTKDDLMGLKKMATDQMDKVVGKKKK